MNFYEPYTAETQAEFYKAEAEMLNFGISFKSRPYAEYMKQTLFAIDALFAVRMAYDIVLPPVSLIVAFDVSEWKYKSDVELCMNNNRLTIQFPENGKDAAVEALHYMQAMKWLSDSAKPGFVATPDTLVKLHDILLNGKSGSGKYSGFRTSFLPHKKGCDPAEIPHEIEKLCEFVNGDYFSPLGQASVVHHAFERVVPFDTLIDRTGLLFAFLPMFRRGLFVNGCAVPISWGTTLEKEYRRQLKDASRTNPELETYKVYKERWGAYNARNTYLAVHIAESFLAQVEELNSRLRAQLKIPANSALDELLNLFLAVPRLNSKHAASCIGKSYGATNEAMHHLVKAGILKVVNIDNRERVFVCEQSERLITGFVDELVAMQKETR